MLGTRAAGPAGHQPRQPPSRLQLPGRPVGALEVPAGRVGRLPSARAARAARDADSCEGRRLGAENAPVHERLAAAASRVSTDRRDTLVRV